jgi:hypothetical protein
MLTEADWKRLADAGVLGCTPVRELARELGCDHTTVLKWRDRLVPKKDRRNAKPPPKAWPKGARQEIARCIDNNDNPPPGWGFIPIRKMVERLRSRWGIEDATVESLTRYCRTVLRRRGWRYQ